MPVVSHKRQLPVLDNYRFMALDEDGFHLPPDWYMRICGFAVEGLRGERLILGTFPSKELQDYWSSRPHYEDVASSSSCISGSGSGSGSKDGDKKGQTWEEWERTTQENADEPPPPPYSLEAEEPSTQSSSNAPPPVPLARRPTQTQGPPTTQLSTRPSVHSSSQLAARLSSGPPPPLASSSRPQVHSVTSVNHGLGSHPSSSHASPLLAPVDELSRLGLSDSMPVSPLYDQAHAGRYSHSPSPRPVSPAHSHHSHHSHHSSHSATACPPTVEPGFSPHLFPVPVTPPSNAPQGQWAQAQWPPPEWGSQPQGPAVLFDQIFHGDASRPAPSPPQHMPGYTPSYPQGHSGHHSPHSSHDSSPRPHGSHGTGQLPGSYGSSPQAHADHGSSYNTPSPPQPHASYGSGHHSDDRFGHTSPYSPANGAGSSTLQPRPSVSHHTRPASPLRQEHQPFDNEVGGFAFPEAHVSVSSGSTYPGGPSSPYPHSPYDRMPQAPAFPGEPAFAPPAGPPPAPPPRKCAF